MTHEELVKLVQKQTETLNALVQRTEEQQGADLSEKQLEAIGGAVKSQFDQLTAPLANKVEELEKQTKAAGDPLDPRNQPKDDPKESGALKEVLELIKAQGEQLKAITSERDETAKSKAARQLVEQTIEKKFPLLKEKATVINRLASNLPEKEEDVLASLDVMRNELKELGADLKPFSATPEGEGGKPGEEETYDEKKIKNIRQQAGSIV